MPLTPCGWLPVTIVGVMLAGVLPAAPVQAAGPDHLTLVPWPRSLQMGTGSMALTADARIVAGEASLLPLAEILSRDVFLVSGLKLQAAQDAARDGDIVLQLAPALKREDYTLTVSTRRAELRGANYNAVAMGTMTLLQALQTGGDRVSLPTMKIDDGPHFEYLATMIDTARKPHSIEVLRQCVDICRFYKIRYIHLHMTDENAWTFPSTAYPQLGSGNYAWAGGEKPEVYDIDELRALIAYADARGVTFVPELESPGHAGQLRSTLPEIFGYKDAAGNTITPGVSNMVRPEAYAAMDTLIGEAAALFKSSPYIVIGGDEASVGEVAELPEVKAYMAEHGLEGIHDLYTHYVARIAEITLKHGRVPMVWEGPPIGRIPLPKQTILLPWVGGTGAAAHMIKEGYRVVNPPWGTNTPYMDPYWVNGAQLPRDEKMLVGTTSLAWQTPAETTLEYMRTTAVLRQDPSYNPHSGRTYEDFLQRQAVTEKRLDMLLHGFTLASDNLHDPLTNYRLNASFSGNAKLAVKTHLDPAKIRYMTDGSAPGPNSPALQQTLSLDRTTSIHARYVGTDAAGRFYPLTRTYSSIAPVKHDAVGAAVTFSPDPGGSYPGAGPKGLTDGLQAVGNNYPQPGWIGWPGGAPIVITIDLGKTIAVRDVTPHFLRSPGGVFPPKNVQVSLSTDGKTYRDAATVDDVYGQANRGWYKADCKGARARYVKVTVTPGGEWTFIDEVAVNLTPPPRDVHHAALGCPVTFAIEPHDYVLPGAAGMTDGYVSQDPNFLSMEWLGWQSRNMDATVDLGKSIAIDEVSVRCLQWAGAGIYIPTRVDVQVSDDGKTFRDGATIEHTRTNEAEFIATLSTRLSGVRARYVRLIAHSGAWLFVDEIMVNPSARP